MGFKPEKSPKLGFLGDAEAVHAAALHYAMGKLHRSIADLALIDAHPQAISIEYGDTEKSSRRIPGQIMGSDEIAFSSLFSFGPNAGWIVELSLYCDSSPYVPDNDAIVKNYASYQIVTGPEYPPTLMLHKGRRAYTASGELTEGVTKAVWINKNEGTVALHALTDTECMTVIQGLTAVQPDVNVDNIEESFFAATATGLVVANSHDIPRA